MACSNPVQHCSNYCSCYCLRVCTIFMHMCQPLLCNAACNRRRHEVSLSVPIMCHLQSFGCVQMAKVGVALTKGQTGASPPFTAAPMDTDLAPEAIASKDAAGQVSGAGTAVKADASASADNHNWVEPQAFKSLVGRGHADFSSGHQQVPSGLACMPSLLQLYTQTLLPCLCMTSQCMPCHAVPCCVM